MLQCMLVSSGSDLIHFLSQNAFRIRTELLDHEPAWISQIDLGVSDKTIRDRAEMMLAVDESLGKIMTTGYLKYHRR